MRKITASALKQLIAESRLLEADGIGPKVVEAPNGKIIHKLFRRKRWLSSALFYPYAVRFANNARRLDSLGFNTVKVLEIAHCRSCGYHLLSYEKVSGCSMRDLIKEAATKEQFIELGEFIAQLHHQGVYFRSLHLGNVLKDDDNQLVLIDIADMQFFRRPLSPSQRLRNFRPLLNRLDDRQLISTENWNALVSAYGDLAALEASSITAIKALGDDQLARE